MSLLDNNEDWYATITTASLSSGIGNYTLSSDSSLAGGGTLKVLRVEVTYDGTDWNVATPLDLEETSDPLALLADINANYSTSDPRYALFNNQIYTLPVATTDVASGMRIFEVKRQKELTGSGNVFTEVLATNDYQMPKEFMEVIEEYITADIYERLGKFNEATMTRATADGRLDTIRRQFQPRNQDFDLNMTSNAFSDYGE